MLANILSIGPPLILVVGMLGVGMSITPRAAESVARRLDRLAVVTALQIVFLPLVGVFTLVAIGTTGPAATAILLISICPGGGISNLFVLFARANTSLSVALTVSSLVIANITIPLTIATLTWLGFGTPVSEAPVFELTLRLLSVIVLPIAVGMLVRYVAPNHARIWQGRLRDASAFMILAILSLVLWIERAAVAADIGSTLPAVVVFVWLALTIGYLVAHLVYCDPSDQFTVTVEFGVRNLAIGTYLAVSLGDDLSFAGPAAVYLLVEATVILALGAGRRTRLRG